MSWKIPLFDIDIGAAEIEAVTEVLSSRWLTMGEQTQAFEAEFGKFVGSRHVFCVSNGTAALHLALAASGIGPGDEVIVPALTFVATANAILYTGATPVFADVSSTTDFTIAPSQIEACLSSRTRAILVMHYAGFPCEMNEIGRIARERQLVIIEDAAHAPGARLGGKYCGTFGVCGCFSFFSNKNMAMGEGGIVTTDDDGIAEKLRLMRSHGMTSLTLDRYKGHNYSYDVIELGYNYRNTELQATIGLVQLRKLPDYNLQRKKLTEYYYQQLTGVPGLTIPFQQHPGQSSYHIFPILLEAGINRKNFMSYLKENGIQTSIHYPPIHQFSYHRQLKESRRNDLTLTEDISQREVTLPLYPLMSFKQIDYIVEIIKRFMAEKIFESSKK